MLKTQLRHAVVVVQFADVFLAPEGVARWRAFLVCVARETTIQRMVVAHEVAFEDQLGVFGGLPGDHRGDAIALGLHMVTEGVTALAYHVQAIGQAAFIIQRAGSIQRAATHALIA